MLLRNLTIQETDDKTSNEYKKDYGEVFRHLALRKFNSNSMFYVPLNNL